MNIGLGRSACFGAVFKHASFRTTAATAAARPRRSTLTNRLPLLYW